VPESGNFEADWLVRFERVDPAARTRGERLANDGPRGATDGFDLPGEGAAIEPPPLPPALPSPWRSRSLDAHPGATHAVVKRVQPIRAFRLGIVSSPGLDGVAEPVGRVTRDRMPLRWSKNHSPTMLARVPR
jgi:hypothetical protein